MTTIINGRILVIQLFPTRYTFGSRSKITYLGQQCNLHKENAIIGKTNVNVENEIPDKMCRTVRKWEDS